MPRLTRQELTDIAMCLRIGARQAREDAEKSQALSVREAHLKAAEFREALAARIEKVLAS